jgi:APA family basic amino acid/polyamine antiporter
MSILVVIYITVSMTALSALTPLQISHEYLQNPLAGIVEYLPFGKEILRPLMAVIAAILLFVASNAGLIGASRLAFNMGEYYQLPTFFHKTHRRFRTPHISLLFFAALAGTVVVLSRGRLSFLADLYNFGAMLAFFFAHLSLIVLRIKKPHMERPFRVPLNIKIKGHQVPITAIFGCLATAAVWVLIVITKPEGRYLGLIWMLGGVAMYLIYRSKKRIEATGQIKIEKIHMPKFKPAKIHKVLLPTSTQWDPATIQSACELAQCYGSSVLAVHVLEVPFSMPLDAKPFRKIGEAEAVLKKIEVIARELNVPIDVQIVRARSTSEALVDLITTGKFDLLILGSPFLKHTGVMKEFGPIAEELLHKASCRLWVCADPTSSSKPPAK